MTGRNLRLPVRARPDLRFFVFELFQIQGRGVFHLQGRAADVEGQRALQVALFQPEAQAEVGGSLRFDADRTLGGQDEGGHLLAGGIEQAHVRRLHEKWARAGVPVADLQVEAGIAVVPLQRAAAQLQRGVSARFRHRTVGRLGGVRLERPPHGDAARDQQEPDFETLKQPHDGKNRVFQGCQTGKLS